LFYSRANIWLAETKKKPTEAKRKREILRKTVQKRRKKYAVVLATVQMKKVEDGYSISVAAVNIADVEKALREKKPNTEEELKTVLPPEVYDMIPLFLSREAEKLAPYRPGIDTRIELRTKADGSLEALP
jgi:uncharacterized protein YlxP (DUF503 family)